LGWAGGRTVFQGFLKDLLGHTKKGENPRRVEIPVEIVKEKKSNFQGEMTGQQGKHKGQIQKPFQ